MFYVLVIPLAAQHRRPSVICAALMNRSTSSVESKTRGHGRHHCRLVNRQGCLGSVPAGACCRSSMGALRVAGAGYCARAYSYEKQLPLDALCVHWNCLQCHVQKNSQIYMDAQLKNHRFIHGQRFHGWGLVPGVLNPTYLQNIRSRAVKMKLFSLLMHTRSRI